MSLVDRVKGGIHAALRSVGLDLVRWPYSGIGQQPAEFGRSGEWPIDFTAADREIIERVAPYTLTSRERLFSLIRAVEYIIRADIRGAVVECGVWKGGSMMAVALTLLRLNQVRDLYLYDTYAGMTEPSEVDVDLFGNPASIALHRETRGEELSNAWAYAPLDGVRTAMETTGYDMNQVRFIVGRVEDTIPAALPDRISILRLDTDWYGSTKHELEHLYPLLSSGGVLLVDDYGHFAGARRATDEYLEGHRIPMMLCRVDYTARIGVKPSN